MTEHIKIGELRSGPGESYRDAIHIAVAPVVAKTRLYPAQAIGFVNEENTEEVGVVSEPIGIVDPFLKHYVDPGDLFWMFLYPNTITSLRHDWSHPAFNPELFDDVAKSKKWIKDFGGQFGLDYEEMIDGAKSYLARGDYICHGGLLEGVSVPDQFWDHYEKVTAKKIDESERGSFFTCSC